MMVLLLITTLMAGEQGILPNRQFPLENNQANEYFEQQQYEEALKLYLDLYGQDTGNGALAYNIGNTYAQLGDMEKALEFYEKATRSDHQGAKQRANFNMGNLAMEANELQEAVGRYVDYLRQNPDDEDAKRNLEIALRRLQQQQQQQDNQDQQDQQDQQEQEQQQQQQSNSGQDDQEQQQQQQQQQQQSDQDQQDQEQQQQQPQAGQDEQEQEQEPQQGNEQQQQQGAEQEEQEIDESVKEQILKALAEREEQQQKEYQERKIGGSKRRAKDW